VVGGAWRIFCEPKTGPISAYYHNVKMRVLSTWLIKGEFEKGSKKRGGRGPGKRPSFPALKKLKEVPRKKTKHSDKGSA